MSRVLVSVILPTYNRAEELVYSAKSVLMQSYTDFELIIVDDGSSEDIGRVVDELNDSRIVYLRSDQNMGVSAARNMGLKAAQGRYIAFQDSDDIWLPGKLENQVTAQLSGQHVSICGLTRRLMRRERSYDPAARWGVSKNIPFSKLVSYPICYVQTWLLPKSMMQDIGCFDEKLTVWEDYDALIRLAYQFPVKSISGTYVISNQRNDGLSLREGSFQEAVDMLLAKHGSTLKKAGSPLATLLHLSGRYKLIGMQYDLARSLFFRAVLSSPYNIRYWLFFLAAYTAPAFLRRTLLRRLV